MDTATRTPALYARVGDIVMTKTNELYRVTKVKQVNYGVVDEAGKNWNLRKTGAFVPPADAVFNDTAVAKVETFKPYEPATPAVVLHAGTVVKFKGGKFANTGLYAVIRSNPSTGTASVALLGGDGGRYIRGVGYDGLEVVDF